MNLEFASSDEVGFWGEIESSLDGGGKKRAKMNSLRSRYHPVSLRPVWRGASDGRPS